MAKIAPRSTAAHRFTKINARTGKHLKTGLGGIHDGSEIVEISRAVFNANDVRMMRQFGHGLRRQTIAGSLRKIVQQYRQPRTVSYGTEKKRLRLRPVHLAAVIVWRQNQCHIVAGFRCPVRQPHRLMHALAAYTRNQYLSLGAGLAHPPHQLNPLVDAQQRSLAGGTAHDIPAEVDLIQLVDVVRDLRLIEMSLVIERSRKSWKDSL